MTVLESLEKMLEVYRDKCITQSAEIERLKQAMEDSLIASVRATTTAVKPPRDPTPPVRSPQRTSRGYVDQIAEELESMVMKNERLERDVARLQRRLDVEEEWRVAAMEFMEMDSRIHRLAACEECYSSLRKKQEVCQGGSSYQRALRAALAKTRNLEKSLRVDV